jgi:hypothetical protein
LNGAPFYHGQTYRVPPDVAAVLRETMAGTWKHEEQVNGRILSNQRRMNMRL